MKPTRFKSGSDPVDAGVRRVLASFAADPEEPLHQAFLLDLYRRLGPLALADALERIDRGCDRRVAALIDHLRQTAATH